MSYLQVIAELTQAGASTNADERALTGRCCLGKLELDPACMMHNVDTVIVKFVCMTSE